jgi:predicted aspartyl protease
MVATRDKKMGRFKVEVELANNDDLAAVRRGDLAPDKVRRAKILGVVDSGATRLVLPSAVAEQLGVPATGKVKVKYANGGTARRDWVEGVYLELQGRHSVFTATLEPKRDTALIGAFVLEELDFLIDCTKAMLYPRDPKMLVSEAE